MASVLIDYGIREENSSRRVHVCPVVKKVYFFKTQAGIYAIDMGHYDEKHPTQGQYITAAGYAVPCQDINGIFEVAPPDNIWDLVAFSQYDREDVKGKKAEQVAIYCFRNGLFSYGIVNALPQEVKDISIQKEGADLIVQPWGHVQVKCDYRGGIGVGGTGNLFIQVAEWNPYNRH